MTVNHLPTQKPFNNPISKSKKEGLKGGYKFFFANGGKVKHPSDVRSFGEIKNPFVSFTRNNSAFFYLEAIFVAKF